MKHYFPITENFVQRFDSGLAKLCVQASSVSVNGNTIEVY